MDSVRSAHIRCISNPPDDNFLVCDHHQDNVALLLHNFRKYKTATWHNIKTKDWLKYVHVSYEVFGWSHWGPTTELTNLVCLKLADHKTLQIT